MNIASDPKRYGAWKCSRCGKNCEIHPWCPCTDTDPVRLKSELAASQERMKWLEDIKAQDADSYALFKKRYGEMDQEITRLSGLVERAREKMAERLNPEIYNQMLIKQFMGSELYEFWLQFLAEVPKEPK